MSGVDEFVNQMRSDGYQVSLADVVVDSPDVGRCQSPSDVRLGKKASKSGWFVLRSADDSLWGSYGCNREDTQINWHSNKKDGQELSRSQLSAISRAKKKMERERKERHDQVARKAQHIYRSTLKDTTHPYLVKKGLDGTPVRIHKGAIAIPAFNEDGEIRTIQFIGEKEKKFLKGGQKQGCYATINGRAEKDTVYICEGWATGQSIAKATDKCVVVAFDKDNLIRVVDIVASKIKDAHIVIAADNDKSGAGQEAAQKAAKNKARVSVVVPSVKKGSDFNDLMQEAGLEEVKRQLTPVQKVAALETSRESTDWVSQLKLNGKGDIIAKNDFNNWLYIAYHPELKNVFVYNEFEKITYVMRCPPWENENNFKPRPLSDVDFIYCRNWLMGNTPLTPTKDNTMDQIIATAMHPMNKINPAIAYFEKIVWDGVPRLDTWLTQHVLDNAAKCDPIYAQAVGRKFLMGLAARAMHPGIKFDTMLILEGRQNAGKSTLAEIMATIGGIPYFLDDMAEISNKEAKMQIQGKLVVEFAELTQMNRADVNELKKFLSLKEDTYRVPFQRQHTKAARQMVFVGTVNPEGPYLRDPTGNRRFWPIPCRDNLKLAAIREVMPHLHAEAAHYVKKGEKLYLEGEMYERAEREQARRVETDAWYEQIAELAFGAKILELSAIYGSLKIDNAQKNALTNKRINKVMTALNYSIGLEQGIQGPRTVYRKKAQNDDFDLSGTQAVDSNDDVVVGEEMPW